MPFQRETPVQIASGGEHTGSYGGGFEPPITHQLAFLGFDTGGTTPDHATIAQHQPRALAWDGAHDALYVAGMGTDSILQIKNASQVGDRRGRVGEPDRRARSAAAPTASRSPPTATSSCGARSRAASSASTSSTRRARSRAPRRCAPGPTLVASALARQAAPGHGAVPHRAEPAISQRGALACASCHPDGRADGLSWRIEKHELQTPLLAGRRRRHASVQVGRRRRGPDDEPRRSTMKRLGGIGLDKDQTDALAAYLEALPAPHTPTRDADAWSRAARSCSTRPSSAAASCHDGATYTDQRARTSSPARRSPRRTRRASIGLAASAPYFHDGSAATLEALLRDRGARPRHGRDREAQRPADRRSDRVPRDAVAATRSCSCGSRSRHTSRLISEQRERAADRRERGARRRAAEQRHRRERRHHRDRDDEREHEPPHAAEDLHRPARGVEDRAEQVHQVVEPDDPERRSAAHTIHSEYIASTPATNSSDAERDVGRRRRLRRAA